MAGLTPLLDPLQGIGLGLDTATQALQGDVGSAIAEHHQNGRDALSLQLYRLFTSHFQGQGQGRSAATGEPGHGALGTNQRACHGQEQLGFGASEGYDADTVAACIRLLEQQLHSALGFRQPLKCGRTRRVQRQDHAARAVLLVAVHMKIFRPDGHAAWAASASQALFGRGSTQGGQHMQSRMACGSSRAGRQGPAALHAGAKLAAATRGVALTAACFGQQAVQ